MKQTQIKFSLCIPHYNRIEYLLENLKVIELQTYPNIEVIISDDCSSDSTPNAIKDLIPSYKYPIVFHRNPTNKGYDFNLRKSMELATGDYCFILGNDDTLWGINSIHNLAAFLIENALPEIGFCNFIEDSQRNTVIERASKTGIIGGGYDYAIKHYRSFSFVAGIILKRTAFNDANTSRFDGSVFVQMYFAAKIIGSGQRLFTIKEPLVLKDILINQSKANSYRDTLPRKWRDFKSLDGGIPGVINVGVEAFKELNYPVESTTFAILKGVYKYSYPYWILDYRQNHSFVGAIGFLSGLFPSKIKEFRNLRVLNRAKIMLHYIASTTIGLFTPIFLFKRLKNFIYKTIKK